MGVFLRGDSWYINFWYKGKQYRESVGPVTKGIAKEKLIVRKREVIQGEYKPKEVKTAFKKFSEQYMKYSKGNKRPKSSLRDECSLIHLLPFFGAKNLSDISAFLVEKYKLARKNEEAAVRTINIELACLRHIFNMAIRWKKTRDNPVKEVKFLKEMEEKDRILSEEEEGRLLETVRTSPKEKHLEPIIITALHTGMRKGEILNLKWSNVDLKNGVIIVEGTKNGEMRKIPMNRKLTEVLERGKKRLGVRSWIISFVQREDLGSGLGLSVLSMLVCVLSEEEGRLLETARTSPKEKHHHYHRLAYGDEERGDPQPEMVECRFEK